MGLHCSVFVCIKIFGDHSFWEHLPFYQDQSSAKPSGIFGSLFPNKTSHLKAPKTTGRCGGTGTLKSYYVFFCLFKENRLGRAFRGVLSIVVVRLCFACFWIDIGSYISRLFGGAMLCMFCSQTWQDSCCRLLGCVLQCFAFFGRFWKVIVIFLGGVLQCFACSQIDFGRLCF